MVTSEVYLSVEESKELSESVADVSEPQQHQRNADDSVRDAYDPTPERLGRNVPVTYIFNIHQS